MDHLDRVVLAYLSRLPIGAAHDAAVEFYRNALFRQPELVEKPRETDPRLHFSLFSVQHYAHRPYYVNSATRDAKLQIVSELSVSDRPPKFDLVAAAESPHE